MRYQEWWMWKFPLEFIDAGFDVITLGNLNDNRVSPNYGYKPNSGNFSPIESAIAFEMSQIKEYMELKLRKDDILFLADLSFPGLFANVLHHKMPSRAYAFCHATSMNDYDYFGKCRHSKFQVERGQAAMFEKIFIGSRYHHDKLYYNDWPRNMVITNLPFPPESIIQPVQLQRSLMQPTLLPTNEKKRFLMSAARPSIQKVDPEIEEAVEEQYQTKIYRKDFHSWNTYSQALRESRVLLITAREETFGYQVVDAVLSGCIPVAPNAFSYPELLPPHLLYNNTTDLFDILDEILDMQYGIPELICKPRMKKFYDNIIQIMRKESEDHPF
jgi:hypothetical protein